MSTTPFLDLVVGNARLEWTGIGWYVRDPLDPTDRPFARRVVVRAETASEASDAAFDALNFADFGEAELLNWYVRPVDLARVDRRAAVSRKTDRLVEGRDVS